jgi:hypothetical protein
MHLWGYCVIGAKQPVLKKNDLGIARINAVPDNSTFSCPAKQIKGGMFFPYRLAVQQCGDLLQSHGHIGWQWRAAQLLCLLRGRAGVYGKSNIQELKEGVRQQRDCG